MTEKEKRNQKKFYMVFFIAVTVIACFFPPSADDLGWATSGGMTLLQNGFRNYNGRYLGNLFALVLTRMPYLLPLVKGGTITGILALVQRISGNKKQSFLYLSAIFLVIPMPLFIEGFVWTAGFTNYMLSVLVILLSMYLLIWKRELTGAQRFLQLLVIFVLGISGQLFMETYTIFTLLFSFGYIIYGRIKYKKTDGAAMVYLIACVIGAAMMFSNGLYWKVFSGGDAYQKIAVQDETLGSGILSIFENLFGVVSFNLLISCLSVLIMIAVFSLKLMRKQEETKKRQYGAMLVLYSCSVVFLVGYLLVFQQENLSIWLQILPGFSLAFWFVASAVAVFTVFDRSGKRKAFLYWMILFILVVPFCLVSPVGPRCFVGAMIVLFFLFKEYFDRVKLKQEHTALKQKKVCAYLLTAILVFNLFGYSQVYFANRQKIAAVRTAVEVGEKEIVLSGTRFRFLVYALDTEYKNEKFMNRFCEYYNLPKDIKISYK